jgi:putative ABC transport system substrate-binding protein
VLMPYQENDPDAKAQLSALTQGLAELGWTDGRNMRIDVRWAAGDVDRMRVFAKELVGLQPDVIFASNTPVTAALQRETRAIPIVFVVVSDPVGEGFVAGLPRPGGNLTGFIFTEAEMAGKSLELLTEIAPGVKRVASMFNPDTAPSGGSYYLPKFEAAVPESFLLVHRAPIILLAARNKVPAVYWYAVNVKDGGLLSYGPNVPDIFRRSASYVDRILRGEKPADLPVQQPTKFELIINLKTAKALGLTVPQSILLRADEVFE